MFTYIMQFFVLRQEYSHFSRKPENIKLRSSFSRLWAFPQLCIVVCLYVSIYVRMYVCMYVCMYECMYVCMFVCM